MSNEKPDFLREVRELLEVLHDLWLFYRAAFAVGAVLAIVGLCLTAWHATHSH